MSEKSMWERISLINDHKYLKEISGPMVSLAKKSIAADKKGKQYKMSDRDKYVRECSDAFSRVTDELERTVQAYRFLGSYPRSAAWGDKFTRTQYIQYHLEAYFVSVAGLIDRLLGLVNSVYRMGLSGDSIRMSVVIRELNLIGESRLVRLLESVRDGTAGIKRTKNDITHSERYTDSELGEIGMYEFVLKHGTEPGENEVYARVIKLRHSFYRREKRELISNNNDALCKVVVMVLDRITPVLVQNLKSLKR